MRTPDIKHLKKQFEKEGKARKENLRLRINNLEK